LNADDFLALLSAAVLLVGAGFGLVASIGLLRMPDLPMRLHATSKAGTLGAGLILLGVALFHYDFGVTTRAVVTALFLVLTGPVAAHIIARAAYFSIGVSLWEGTRVNELEGRHDLEAHELSSQSPEEREAERLRERERERQQREPRGARRKV
jgi:multicomponent Na+:H+ antiporter subunit G